MEKEIEKLQEENKKLRMICFYLIKQHRVKPEGIKQGRKKSEINEMSLATMKYMLESKIDPKVETDYKRAFLKVYKEDESNGTIN